MKMSLRGFATDRVVDDRPRLALGGHVNHVRAGDVSSLGIAADSMDIKDIQHRAFECHGAAALGNRLCQ